MSTHTGKGYKLWTYANGSGQWRARVEFNPALLPEADDAGIQNNARKTAQRALRKELMDRGQLGDNYLLKLEVVTSRMNHETGELFAITYGEL